MEGRCVRIVCTLRLKDLPKAKVYSVWLIASICFNLMELLWLVIKMLKPNYVTNAIRNTSYEGQASRANWMNMKIVTLPAIAVLRMTLITRNSNLNHVQMSCLLSVQSLFYGTGFHKKNANCIICCQYFDAGLTPLPKLANVHFISHHKLWCPSESQLCSDHLVCDDLHPDVTVNLVKRAPRIDHPVDRSDQTINNLFDTTHNISMLNPLPRLEFTRLTDDDCTAWIGWTLNQFKQIHATR